MSGGVNKEEATLHSAHAFNLLLNQWEPLPLMKETRHSHGSVTLGSKVYVYGGVSTANPELMLTSSEAIECLDLSSKLGYG